MPDNTIDPSEREALNLRIEPGDWGLIDRAAKVQGKNPASFVLDAACAAAEEELQDRSTDPRPPSRGSLRSTEACAAFLARLDIPPQPNERLRKTMQARVPWDEA